MLKILHTGDIHLGDLAGPTKGSTNLRRQDTLACMDAVVNRAELERPNITIIAGDLFNRSRVWADTALEDVNDVISRFIFPLCACSEAVVLLFGTMNHDNPIAFEVIRKTTTDLRNLRIYTAPKLDYINLEDGMVQIVAVPGFDKGRLRVFCPGVDKEDENRNATALVNEIIMGLGAQINHEIPSILTAHYTVAGSEADNGSTFLAGQDVVVLPDTIDAIGVDLACFGHIHRPQRLLSHTPAYYCGSVNQLTFNDEGIEHGFYIHTIFDNKNAGVGTEFVHTPERRHQTVRLTADFVPSFIADPNKIRFGDNIRGDIVRVRYSCTPEQDKAFNKAELQKKLMQAGAFHVAEIVPEGLEELDAKDHLTEHDGPVECLIRWLDMNEITGHQAERLKELALPIIRQADDGRDAAKHTGAFIPKTIEVKNYRSYTSATFDFDTVHMAMVNGQNGVGKSSLFMDAIADCLYEQTRKEDIGGWVRDGTKSGVIAFTFEMGGQEYRVIRTRTKSGRGTLALQRFDTEAQGWKDESDTTMRLTQSKIERLLGMDCDTFCSIALIRQDAYGLFLEADSDRRMEVLSALLDLGIYTRMEEIAKTGATEQRRKIAATKDRITILSEQVDAKENLLAEDAEIAEDSRRCEQSIAAAEAALREAEHADALRAEIIRSADEKLSQAAEYTSIINSKRYELAGLERKLENAERLVGGLPNARAAAESIKEARRIVRELAPQREQYRSAAQEEMMLRAAKTKAEATIHGMTYNIRSYQQILMKEPEIINAEAALDNLAAEREKAQTRMTAYQAASDSIRAAKASVDSFVSESRVRISTLKNKIAAAKEEAGRLSESGCPAPNNAVCRFLASARKAFMALPDMERELVRTKENDCKRYAELMSEYNLAKSELEALGNPGADLTRISNQERTFRQTANLRSHLATAQAKVEEAESAIETARQEIADYEPRIAELLDLSNRLSDAVRHIEDAEETISKDEALAETLTACQSAQATVEAVKPQIESLKTEIDETLQKKAIALLDADNIRKRISAPTVDADGLRRQISAGRTTLNMNASKRGEIKAKLNAISDAEAQISDLRIQVEEIATNLQDYQTLAHAFGLDGIQYMIIRGVVPEIMRRSNDILSAMTGGRMAVDIRTEKEQKSTKQIVNSLEVWINTIAGGNRPYQSHSGGEKVKIALAVTLGLADVKARRAGVQLGMLFIDEPPFLDADGTETYADALMSMAQRNPEMRILAISHDPAMKARFSQNIVVTGGEDGSSVTME